MDETKKRVIGCIGVCLFLIFAEGVSHAKEDNPSGPTLDLQKIVVTPSKFAQYYKNSSVDVNVIEEDEIASSGATEVTQVLNTLPMVDVIDYGAVGANKSVHIRGADGSQIVTLIDGRPIATPRDSETNFNQIPLSNIERIEVVRGPASSIYGANAVGGVINIITKSGKEKMSTELDLKSGSYFTQGADFANGWKIGKMDYFLSADYLRSDGARINSNSDTRNYNLKLGYDADKDNRFTLASEYIDSELGTPYKNNETHPHDRQNEWNHYFDFTWDGSCWRDSKVLFKAYQNSDRLEFISDFPKAAHVTEVYGTDLQISQMWFEVFRTSFGVSGQENMLDSSTSDKHRYNFKAVYAETELDPFKDLTLKGGARLDDYSNFGSRTSPSASFSWIFFDMIKTHGLVARSFRAPTFNDLYWPRQDYEPLYGPGSGGVEGNPNLKPEIGFSREIGLGSFIFNKIDADITYFSNKFKDLINWAEDNTHWWRPSNVNSAVIDGVETNFNFQATKDLRLNLNYTRLSAIDAVTQKWITYRPRHEYKGSLDYNFKDRWDIYLTGRYLSRRYTLDDNSGFLKSYFVAYANISYKITKFAEVMLSVNNIFDRNYQEEEGYPLPGVNYLITTRLKF